MVEISSDELVIKEDVLQIFHVVRVRAARDKTIYTVSQKREKRYTFVHIFAQYRPIFVILSPTHSAGNWQ